MQHGGSSNGGSSSETKLAIESGAKLAAPGRGLERVTSFCSCTAGREFPAAATVNYEHFEFR
jgi:hypothetical protein